MSALVTGEKKPDVGSAEMGTAMGNAIAVCIRMEQEPDKANISNCERSLRNAASAVMQLWDKVQDEKARCEKAVTRTKQRALPLA